MNLIKEIYIRFMAYIKVFGMIAIIGISFYSGMYAMSAAQNPEDAKGVMVAKLEQVFKDTSNQPIVHIVPEPSLYEKAKLKLGMELPEREVVTIVTTTNTKRMLGVKVQHDPNMAQTALIFWADKANKVSDGTVSAWNWWSDKITVIK